MPCKPGCSYAQGSRKAPEAPSLMPCQPDAPAPDGSLRKCTEVPKPDAPKAARRKATIRSAANDVKALRMWTDASGKYQLEARFVSFQDGTVRLQKANGGYVRIAYDRLSDGDRDFRCSMWIIA